MPVEATIKRGLRGNSAPSKKKPGAVVEDPPRKNNTTRGLRGNGAPNKKKPNTSIIPKRDSEQHKRKPFPSDKFGAGPRARSNVDREVGLPPERRDDLDDDVEDNK